MRRSSLSPGPAIYHQVSLLTTSISLHQGTVINRTIALRRLHPGWTRWNCGVKTTHAQFTLELLEWGHWGQHAVASLHLEEGCFTLATRPRGPHIFTHNTDRS